MGRLDVRIVEARNLPNKSLIAKPDPYTSVSLENSQHKTSVAASTLNPKWDEVFKFVIADPDSAQLELKVYDKNLVSDTFLGQYRMSLAGLTKGVVKDVWVLLQQCSTNAELHIRLMAHDFGIDPTPAQLQQQQAAAVPVPVVQQSPPQQQQFQPQPQPMMQQQQPMMYQQQPMMQPQPMMQQPQQRPMMMQQQPAPMIYQQPMMMQQQQPAVPMMYQQQQQPAPMMMGAYPGQMVGGGYPQRPPQQYPPQQYPGTGYPTGQQPGYPQQGGAGYPGQPGYRY